MAEAKAKIRARHNKAIMAYNQWWDEHPRASLEEQVKMFDLFVDTAKLNQLAGEKQTTKAGVR
jgi:hypothetical protein